MNKSLGSMVILISILAAVGQITNTIYVPAMVLIAKHFAVSAHSVQYLMAAYLLPYGLSQFIYGPLSDHFGRRPIILLGLIIYLFGSLLTCTATQFSALIIGSFIQGLGIGVAGVMARTVMRDLYEGQALQRANALMSTVLVVAPLLAPVIGGLLSYAFYWRACFFFLLSFAALVCYLQYTLLPETNHHRGKQSLTVMQIVGQYRTLITCDQFKTYAICVCCAFAGVAIFEACSGILFANVLHYSTLSTSIFFILPLPAYMLGNYSASYLHRFLALHTLLLMAISLMLVSGGLMALFALFKIINLTVILGPMIIFLFAVGIIFPTATTGAVGPYPKQAGTAGALLGGLQNLVAGGLTILSGLIPQHNQLPLAGFLIVLSLIMFATYAYFIGFNNLRVYAREH